MDEIELVLKVALATPEWVVASEDPEFPSKCRAALVRLGRPEVQILRATQILDSRMYLYELA